MRSVVVPMRRALITRIVVIEKAASLLIDLETPGAGIAWNEAAVDKYSVTF